MKLTLTSPAVTIVAAVLGFQFRPFYQFNFTASQLVTKTRMDDNGSTMDRSQRSCSEPRAKKFAEYLIHNIKNDLSWVIPPIMANIDTDGIEDAVCFESMADTLNTPDDITARSVGKLGISGDAFSKLFDGQHRTRGIAIALDILNQDKKNRDAYLALRSKSISIMAFIGLTLEERQAMFADINLNMAKPQASIGIAYDHRDGLSRFAVEIAQELPFKGLVELEKNTVGKKSDKLYPLKTIKDLCQSLMGLGNKYQQNDITEDKKAFVRDVLAKFSRGMGWAALEFEGNAAELRDTSIITHTVMLKAMAEAAKVVSSQFPEFKDVNLNQLADLDYSRTGGDFLGRCIDPISNTMRMNQTGIKLAANKLVVTVGAKLDPEAKTLEKQYFGDLKTQSETTSETKDLTLATGYQADTQSQASGKSVDTQPQATSKPTPTRNELFKGDVRVIVLQAAGNEEKTPNVITRAAGGVIKAMIDYENKHSLSLVPLVPMMKDHVLNVNENEGDAASWNLVKTPKAAIKLIEAALKATGMM